MATLVKTEVTTYDFKIYLTAQLYRKIEMMEKNTFTASNGIKVKCHQRYNNTYNEKSMKLDERACDSIFLMSSVKDPKKLEAALTELGSLEFFDSSWTTFGQSSGLRLAFKKENVISHGYKLKLDPGMYDWLDEKKFTASNGISFFCDDKFNPGFINGIIELSGDFKGKESEIGPEFTNLAGFKAKISQVEAAIAEMNAAFAPLPQRTIIKINLSEKAYLHAQHKFQASNGIIIEAATRFHPGFENGNSDTLYLDDRFNGKEVSLGAWFKNRHQLSARMDEVTVALREIEEAPVPQGPPPKEATTPKSDQAARLLAALMARALLEDD